MRNVAERQSWVLNPDEEFRRKIEEGLATNLERYGYLLCPCRDGDGERQAERDITCPCDYAKADIAEYGHCFCGLFMSPAFASSGKTVSPIPERREES